MGMKSVAVSIFSSEKFWQTEKTKKHLFSDLG
jgi:hypothetical protein